MSFAVTLPPNRSVSRNRARHCCGSHFTLQLFHFSSAHFTTVSRRLGNPTWAPILPVSRKASQVMPFKQTLSSLQRGISALGKTHMRSHPTRLSSSFPRQVMPFKQSPLKNLNTLKSSFFLTRLNSSVLKENPHILRRLKRKLILIGP